MTVIVTDGKTMVGDGLTMMGWTICSTTTRKVIRLDDGRLLGCTGDAVGKAQLAAWLNGKDPKPVLSEGFKVLVADGSDTIREYHADLTYIELPAPQAIGCGSDIAFGALDMGANCQRAVEIACQRSIGCGGTITAMTVEVTEQT